MSFYICANQAGDRSTPDFGTTGAGTVSTGYSVQNGCTGQRETRVRYDASSGSKGFGYYWTSDYACEYAAIIRADWLLSQNGTRVRLQERNSGGTWATIAGKDYNPILAANLVGPRSQDFITNISPADLRGVRALFDPVSGTEALLLGKLYAGKKFSFGINPPLATSWIDIPPGTFVTPLQGTELYEIERRITLQFTGITRALATEFKAIPEILNWPVLLWDESQSLWDHELEHVLIENYVETVVENDRHTIVMNCARLKQNP